MGRCVQTHSTDTSVNLHDWLSAFGVDGAVTRPKGALRLNHTGSIGYRRVFDASSDNALPDRLLAVPVMVFLAAVLLPAGLHVGPLYLTCARMVLLIMILPLGINLLRGKYGPVLFTDICFALSFLWMVIALAVNNPPAALENAGSTGVEFLGSYILGRAFIRTRESFVALIKLFIAMIVLCAPFAIAEALTGTSVPIAIIDKLPGLAAPIDLAIERRLGLERVQFSFEHPIHWGLFCALATALVFVGLGIRVSLRTRLTLTAVTGLGGFLSLSSGAILAISLQLGLVCWAFAFHENPWKWAILLGVSAICYGVIDILSNRTPLQVFMSYATFSAHSAYWRSTIFQWGMVNIWANPVFGIGLNDWVRPIWMLTPSVDNFWLLTAMRFGLPAFSFLTVGYLWALWKVGRRAIIAGSELWRLRRAWVICFSGIGFALATVHIWGAISALVFFFFGSGMWLCQAEEDSAPNPTPSRLPAFARQVRVDRFTRFDRSSPG